MLSVQITRRLASGRRILVVDELARLALNEDLGVHGFEKEKKD